MSKASDNFVEKCKKFWDEAEKTDDGMTVGQLCRVVRKAAPNVGISDAEIAEIFMDVDADGDRLISWDEFSEVFKKKDPKKVQENELHEAFQGMDKDGSGKLSPKEVKEAFAALNIQISDDALSATMADADKDGDGKINFKEFLSAWSCA